jgi:uncharacterized cupredoxin-like copper-binding protein
MNQRRLARVTRRLALCAVGLAACAPLGIVQPGTPQAPEVLKVALTDGSTQVRPRMVARGKVGLEVSNDGTLEHGVHVVGPGVDEQSDEFLSPGQRRTMWLELAPGTFRVFCPDGDHAERGMSAQFVVTDRASWFRR